MRRSGDRRKSRDANQTENLGRAASGGALAPEPPRVTRNPGQPESIRIRAQNTSFQEKFLFDPALFFVWLNLACARIGYQV